MPKIEPQFKVRSLEGSIERPPPRVRGRSVAPGVTSADMQQLDGRPVARFHLKLDAPNDTPLNELTAKLLQAVGEHGDSFYRPGADKVSRGIYDRDIFILKRPPAKYEIKMFKGR